MTDRLKLNDPVTADSSTTTGGETSSSLEGIVAHLGPVQFASGDDWVGMRLTGTSTGKGKNNGSVDGIVYFECGGENNGMFVKRTKVTKRKLSKLEELRLRRELSEAGGGVASSSGSSSVTTTTTRRTTRSSAAATSTTKATTPTKTTTPTKSSAPSTKLEELRAKREALARERGGNATRDAVSPPITNKDSEAITTDNENDEEGNVTSPVKDDDGQNYPKDDKNEISAATITTTTNVSSTPMRISLTSATPGYRAELARLQTKISTLETDLRKKNAECASLQSSLEFMSKGAEQSTHDAVRMYAMGALAMSGGVMKGTSPTKASPRRSLVGEMKLEGKVSGDEDEDDEEEEEEGVVNQAAAAVSRALVERNDELKKQLSDLTSVNADLHHRISETEERMSNITQRFERANENYQTEKQARNDDTLTFTSEKAVLTSQLSSLERELKVLQERVSDKSTSQDHSHLTLTKLRAEVTSLQRKNEELTNDKTELENTLEDLVLDKEQLGHEKETLEDLLEEMKVDLESAQLELDDVKAQLEMGNVEASAAEKGDVDESSETSAALVVQNSRLRTALIRLREQSELERNDLQRQLKAYQSDSASNDELRTELVELRKTHATTLADMQDLKDTIDQTSALEETIETLSDKVWNLEETNANLERTIRELEEAAEIAAEMEEVQTEELKLTLRDLEGRDALVRNLEEVIKMQRRREEDFQRYVSEFRASIVTLKREKAALLAVTDDDRGDKASLLSTSKKALAQAAQLATDAAEARKRNSEAAFHMITARSATYLNQRLGTLLPSGVVSAELAAMKGEMNLAKVADKAAISLTAVEEVFNKAVEKGLSGISEFNTLEDGASMSLTDASSQQIATINHQAAFATVTIEAATDALRLMAAGQWPDLLSEEQSTELGTVVLHSITDLDFALSDQLKLIKSEGMLSPMRSSLSDLDQSVRNTRLAIFGFTDDSGQTIIPKEWKPPGWEALKNLSQGRFAVLAATAALCSAVSPMEESENEPPPATPQNLVDVLTKAKQSCASILDICKNFSGLQLSDIDVLVSLDELSIQFQNGSKSLFECVKTTLSTKSVSNVEVAEFSSLLDIVISSVRLLAALIRKAELDKFDAKHHHYLSAEYGDSWMGVTEVVSQVRQVNGDPEDLNYLMRARSIESQLADAVQNEPKLVIADAKIVSLEKNLASRAKEIEMQNRRLAELESMLARMSSATSMSPIKDRNMPSTPSGAPVDTQNLKEEIRMLQEALDVMQKQADEYEKEIRSLKDKSRPVRSNMRSARGSITPKSSAMDLEATLSQLGQGSGGLTPRGSNSRDALLESVSLETALFRPALTSAVESSNYWKSKALGSALSQLAPLNVTIGTQVREDMFGLRGNNKTSDIDCMNEIALAKSNMRLAKASFSIVDLSKADISARAQLTCEQQKKCLAEERLLNAIHRVSATTDLRPSLSQPIQSRKNSTMVGRITLPSLDREGCGSVRMSVTNADLRNVHSFLVQ